jgi:ABC-type glycerol-3-phosphate transport system substrate-binding protein
MIEFLAPTIPDNGKELLLQVLQAHQVKTNRQINLICHDWEYYRRELVNTCIHRAGGDIAEVGSTWLGSMISMNCLRPFSNQELRELGGRESFFAPLWQDITLSDDQETWGIPFRADARVIFYWEDMLEAAHVDPATAFGSFDGMTSAFEKLQGHGSTPWAVVTQLDNHDSVYNLASWIHKAGGDFLAASGKKTAFARPEAIAGIQAYFDLYRFMPQQGHPLNDNDVLGCFAHREAAATMGGPWLFNFLRQQNLPANVLQRLKVALPPGPSFVGGTVLVVFQHARELAAIISLLKKLYEPGFLSQYSIQTGLLPVQEALWTEAYLQSDLNLHLFRQAITNGRSLPDTPLWGMIEDRLTVAIGGIWKEIYSTPSYLQPEALRNLITAHLEPVARRLDTSLAG